MRHSVKGKVVSRHKNDQKPQVCEKAYEQIKPVMEEIGKSDNRVTLRIIADKFFDLTNMSVENHHWSLETQYDFQLIQFADHACCLSADGFVLSIRPKVAERSFVPIITTEARQIIKINLNLVFTLSVDLDDRLGRMLTIRLNLVR